MEKAKIINNGNVNLERITLENTIGLRKDISYNTLLGEFIGTLEGIICWDIPLELKQKLEKKIAELNKIKL